MGDLSAYASQSTQPPPTQQQTPTMVPPPQQQQQQPPPTQQQQLAQGNANANNAQNQSQNNFAASVIKSRMQVEPGKLELEVRTVLYKYKF